MKIIKINNLYQGHETLNPQLIDNHIPKWCVRTEMSREKDGGYLKWINDKEEFVNTREDIDGIFLYNITASYQKIGGDGFDIVYYIRYDYIKKSYK